VRANIDRLVAAWSTALSRSNGPFLGGNFGAVDAYFAPVVIRLDTYGLPVSPEMRAYMDRVIAFPAVADWIKTAIETAVFIDFEEPYRSSPDM
jgi:glutathione S-transferase